MLSKGITRLNEQTNRETFKLYWQANDAGDGSPLNLSGVVGLPQTIGHWVVRAGNAVITDTVTPITVPQYPYSGELLAVSFVIPGGLAISAGSALSLTSLDQLNTLTGYVISYNTQTGATVAQIGMSFQFEIRAKSPTRDLSDGYSSFPNQGIGTVSNVAPILTASLGDGKIKFIEMNKIEIRIPESECRRLWNTTFAAALTMNNSQDQAQVFLADLPVLGGGVSQ